MKAHDYTIYPNVPTERRHLLETCPELGHGGFARVFVLDEDRIVKITRDPATTALLAELQLLSPQLGFPVVYENWGRVATMSCVPCNAFVMERLFHPDELAATEAHGASPRGELLPWVSRETARNRWSKVGELVSSLDEFAAARKRAAVVDYYANSQEESKEALGRLASDCEPSMVELRQAFCYLENFVDRVASAHDLAGGENIMVSRWGELILADPISMPANSSSKPCRGDYLQYPWCVVALKVERHPGIGKTRATWQTVAYCKDEAGALADAKRCGTDGHWQPMAVPFRSARHKMLLNMTAYGNESCRHINQQNVHLDVSDFTHKASLHALVDRCADKWCKRNPC